MMDSNVETLYCSQQIIVPLNLPYILKQYAKAAIRTQPNDLLLWSVAYFRCLSKGEVPPVKDRFEYPPITSPSGLSPGFLKVLIKQFGKKGLIRENYINEKWVGIGLNTSGLTDILKITGVQNYKVRWLNFVAVAAGFLCPSLTQTMILLCELLTDDPEGGPATIPVDMFLTTYKYLARINCERLFESTDSNLTQLYQSKPGSGESLSDSKSIRVDDLDEVTDQIDELHEEAKGKDSTAGLMVWEDIVRCEQHLSPKESIGGITSDQGLMVFSVQPPDLTDEEIMDYKFDQEEFNKASSEEEKKAIVFKYYEIQARREAIAKELKGKEENEIKKVSDKEFEKQLKAEDDALKLIHKKPQEQTPTNETTTKSPEQKDGTRKKGYKKKIVNKIYTLNEQYQIIDLEVKEYSTEDKLKMSDDPLRTGSSPLNTDLVEDNELDDGSSSDESVYVAAKIGDSFMTLEDDEEWVEIEAEDSYFSSDQPTDVAEPKYSYHNTRRLVKRKKLPQKSQEPSKVEPDLEIDVATENPKDEKRKSGESLKGKEKQKVYNVSRINLCITESIDDSRSEISEPGSEYFMNVPGIGPVVPEQQIQDVVLYMTDKANKQDGYVMPRNIRHFMCPPLDCKHIPLTSSSGSDESKILLKKKNK